MADTHESIIQSKNAEAAKPAGYWWCPSCKEHVAHEGPCEVCACAVSWIENITGAPLSELLPAEGRIRQIEAAHTTLREKYEVVKSMHAEMAHDRNVAILRYETAEKRIKWLEAVCRLGSLCIVPTQDGRGFELHGHPTYISKFRGALHGLKYEPSDNEKMLLAENVTLEERVDELEVDLGKEKVLHTARINEVLICKARIKVLRDALKRLADAADFLQSTLDADEPSYKTERDNVRAALDVAIKALEGGAA